MLLIPAIDLKDGKCVRLRQGRMDEATVFGDDPVAMASHWREQGARRLHIVDLDGAFAGQPKNGALIEAMVKAMEGVPVQVGGGIRSLEVIQAYLEAGVAAAIIGTRAVEEPAFLAEATTRFPRQIILGLDARDGKIATDGWDNTSTLDATAFAHQAAKLDLFGIVYTDISRDGMMSGLNVEATHALATASGVPVIASGGVTSLGDIEALRKAFRDTPDLLLGAITGRAIYEGSFDLAQGQALFDA